MKTQSGPAQSGPAPPGIPDGTILFDGVCVLCSFWFHFVARRDKAAQFRFLAIQDADGRRVALALGIDPDAPSTNAVITGGKVFVRSDAAIEVLRRLPFWRWIVLARLIPPWPRDRLYDLVARNRYRWFGQTSSCLVPSPELRRHIFVPGERP